MQPERPETAPAMNQQTTSPLYKKPASIEFYENRYARGYMEEWPAEKKRRIAEMIRSLGLPGTGEALDFGCGNGVLTDVLRESLPTGWRTCGSDLSAKAIENARKWYPGCRFFFDGDSELESKIENCFGGNLKAASDFKLSNCLLHRCLAEKWGNTLLLEWCCHRRLEAA